MKVLIMDTLKTLGRDGSTIHRWELARNLSKLGHEVQVMSYTNIKPEGVRTYTLSKKSKIKYIIHLTRLVKLHHFDIIYTRNIVIGSIGLLLKKVWKSKLILEINGISSDERRLIEKQLTKREKLNSIKIIFFGYFGIFIIKKADAIIAVTPGIKNYLIDHGVDKTKIWVIKNGANTELFKPIEDSNVLKELKNGLHINNDEKVVLFVGYLAPWQGVEYLLRAAPLIIKENSKTKFVIVGNGALRVKLESLSKELGIGQNVLFTGAIHYDKVPLYLNISDVCIVLKRKMRSGYSPLKLYEYMACGKPVIATNTEGFEILEQYNAGILVNPEDSEELSNAIVELLQNKQLREQMGANGRKLVVREHSWENIAKKTAEVFRK